MHFICPYIFLSKLSYLILIVLNFRKWFKYGLKAQKLLAQGNGRKQHALKGQKLIAQGSARKQYALKGQKLLAQGSARKQHALKGQKLLAQGIALGCLGR